MFAAARTMRLSSQDGGRRESPKIPHTPPSPEDAAARAPSEATAAQILETLAEVRTYLATEIVRNTNEVKLEILVVGARTAALELRLESTAVSHNAAVAQINRLTSRLALMESTLDDLGNRSRRNNVRLRGLPEQEGEGPQAAVATAIFKPLLPEVPEHLWHIERAHRALRAKWGDNQHPREVIVEWRQVRAEPLLARDQRRVLGGYFLPGMAPRREIP
ncbi:Hypothetical predicted protein [Pelobates cultripes]|uniref:Uncharacterized protein n=1 Tax=Pelobates cultripes TaxID=61616 RepID=A0AAD1SHA4_PELCU|nr:Hypothetical predicted protein [Pelobates cultripes]